MTRNFDVAVIGASVGGSSTALHLARHGLSTLLVDSVQFPRRKPCGEGLSMLGIKEIEELGICLTDGRYPHRRFYGFQFVEGAGRSNLQLPLLGDVPFHGIGIQRYILDQVLIDKFRASGQGEVHLGAPVAIKRQGDGFLVTSGEEEFRSRFLVLATGAQSRLPQELGVPTVRTPTHRCGVRLDLKIPPAQVERETVRIYLADTFEVVCTPVSSDRLNLAITATGADARQLKSNNLPKIVEQLNNEMGLNGVLCEEPLGVAGLGEYRRSESLGNIFLVGDALLQLDPIGGMGMTQALASARLTAAAIRELAASSSKDLAAARLSHRKRLRKTQRRLMAHTHISYWSLVHPVSRLLLGRLKTGRLAQEVLLSIHRPPAWSSPAGAISRLVISSAGLL